MAQLKVHINFEPGVTLASAAFAIRKYNKKAAFCFQFDDGSKGMLVADQLWDGYTYTDGCGNNINYKGSVGMNAGTGVPGSNDYSANVYSGPELIALINKNHDVENHSYYHTGNTNNPPTETDLTNDLISVVFEDDVINKYTKYKMAGFIIPENYTGYDPACEQLHYLSCISQGAAPFMDGSTVYDQGQIPDDIDQIPDFFRLTRFFNDDWSDSAIEAYKSAFLEISAGPKNIMCMFTHITFTNAEALRVLTEFFDYCNAQANDYVIFASLREILEYTQMRKCPLTQDFDQANNKLTLTVDTDNLNSRTRFMDCCFNITANKYITGISVEGFQSAVYNHDTGLINAFLQKKSWEGVVAPVVPDPVQEIIVKHGKFVA